MRRQCISSIHDTRVPRGSWKTCSSGWTGLDRHPAIRGVVTRLETKGQARVFRAVSASRWRKLRCERGRLGRASIYASDVSSLESNCSASRGHRDRYRRAAWRGRRAPGRPGQIASVFVRGLLLAAGCGGCRAHVHPGHVRHPRHADHGVGRPVAHRAVKRQQAIPYCQDVQHQEKERCGGGAPEHV